MVVFSVEVSFSRDMVTGLFAFKIIFFPLSDHRVSLFVVLHFLCH